MNRDEDRLLLSVPQAAARLGVAKSLAYALVRRGELPSVRVGRRAVRVPVKGLEAWIAGQTRGGAVLDDITSEVKP